MKYYYDYKFFILYYALENGEVWSCWLLNKDYDDLSMEKIDFKRESIVDENTHEVSLKKVLLMGGWASPDEYFTFSSKVKRK